MQASTPLGLPGPEAALAAERKPPTPPEQPTAAYTAFSRGQRILIVGMATTAATFTSFASNIYFPAIPTIAVDLGTTVENINFTVTSYMIFQAITPTFWGAMSDVYGRRATLISTLTLFFSANIGLALLKHYYQLIILRCLQSAGSASTIAIGSGIIGDVTRREERGGIMGIFQGIALLPLAIGPVIGGAFAGTLGWRAIFWFLVIYSGAFLIFLAIVFPETLRAIVDNGSIPPPRLLRAPLETWTASRTSEETKTLPKAKLDYAGPIRVLFSLDVFFVLFFLSIHYAAWQMSLTAQSSLFASAYGLGEVDLGLTFLANGLGCMMGTLTTGRILDRDYARYKASFEGEDDDFPIEVARLRSVWLWSPVQALSVIMFGWTIDRQVNITAPIIATFLMAWSAMSAQSAVSTFLVDIFPKSAASATAALNLARCLVGAGATASVEPTIKRIGTGGTFTMWAGFMILSLGFVGVQMRYGTQWRKRRESKAAAP